MKTERPIYSEYRPAAVSAVSVTQWLLFILSVMGLKCLIFIIDPLPMFYLGDSWSYIHTALSDWIPSDRSFVYGFLIKFIAVSAYSLTPLVFAQLLTSGINSILITYILLKFFSVSPRRAFTLGIISALEPIHLLYERYIMTEAFSLFSFAVFVLLIFHYLKKANIFLLFLVQIAGTVLISFRLSFLPVVIVNSILLPFLSIPVLINKYDLKSKISGASLKISAYRTLFIALAIHLIVSAGATYFLHAGYKQLNGFLSQKPPAYQYQTGMFLLANWAPIIKPVDLARPDISDMVFKDLKFNLADRRTRSAQHWQFGGIVSRINEALPDELEAERVARGTALNALKRDPMGVVSLAMHTFADFWNLDILHHSLEGDLGDRPLFEEMLGTLRNNFSLAADKLPSLVTFTKQYYLFAWPWYLFVLCCPFFALGCLAGSKRDARAYSFILFLYSSIIVSVVCTLSEGPTVRFLHALAWVSFICTGVLIQNISTRLQGKN